MKVNAYMTQGQKTYTFQLVHRKMVQPVKTLEKLRMWTVLQPSMLAHLM